MACGLGRFSAAISARVTNLRAAQKVNGRPLVGSQIGGELLFYVRVCHIGRDRNKNDQAGLVGSQIGGELLFYVRVCRVTYERQIGVGEWKASPIKN